MATASLQLLSSFRAGSSLICWSFCDTSQSANSGTSLSSSRFKLGTLGCKITSSLLQSAPFNGFPQRAAQYASKQHISSILASSLQMHTPQGEALLAMTKLRLPPSLILQAASQQLELLAAAAEGTSSSRDEATRSTGQERVLNRRIAEVKEKEIAKAFQDIILTLITHRLMHATLADSNQDATITLQGKLLDDRLQSVHPADVQPLINRHVAIVINGMDKADLPLEANVLARVGKLEMGKVYAASVMYGYFLARLHQRFKLERLLQLEVVSMEPNMQRDGYGGGLKAEMASMDINGVTGLQSKADSMEAYMQGEGDKEAFRNMSSISCSHTLEVIDRHCRALFGNIRIHKPCHMNTTTATTSPSILTIQVGYLRSLILQALGFGALSWEIENTFISRVYPF